MSGHFIDMFSSICCLESILSERYLSYFYLKEIKSKFALLSLLYISSMRMIRDFVFLMVCNTLRRLKNGTLEVQFMFLSSFRKLGLGLTLNNSVISLSISIINVSFGILMTSRKKSVPDL